MKFVILWPILALEKFAERVWQTSLVSQIWTYLMCHVERVNNLKRINCCQPLCFHCKKRYHHTRKIYIYLMFIRFIIWKYVLVPVWGVLNLLFFLLTQRVPTSCPIFLIFWGDFGGIFTRFAAGAGPRESVLGFDPFRPLLWKDRLGVSDRGVC